MQSDQKKQTLYIDANILNGWAMSQFLPTGEFENISFLNIYQLDQIVEDFLQIPDDNEYSFFIECDIEYPVENKEKTKKLFIVPLSNKSRSTFIHTLSE